ncbi:hypothetical protein L208DRAFT_1407295, partial [Tricholoma matsutake]
MSFISCDGVRTSLYFLGLKSRRLEKKKLPPLRTQPYEAPYFFPSPMLVGKTSSGSKFHTLPTAIDFARTV